MRTFLFVFCITIFALFMGMLALFYGMMQVRRVLVPFTAVATMVVGRIFLDAETAAAATAAVASFGAPSLAGMRSEIAVWCTLCDEYLYF